MRRADIYVLSNATVLQPELRGELKSLSKADQNGFPERTGKGTGRLDPDDRWSVCEVTEARKYRSQWKVTS